MNYKTFFKAIGNENPICIINNDKEIPMSEIKNHNRIDDLYFIPNSGGRKASEITKFNCFFVDFDCGRDENDSYYDVNIVKEFKKSTLVKIDAFKFSPNTIIETRNGYHVYWYIKEDISSELWRRITNALIKYFSSDKKVCSPANQMRIPGTWWVKKGYAPFLCTIIHFDDHAFTSVDSLCDFLGISASNPEKIASNKTKSKYAYNETKKTKNCNEHIHKEYPKKIFRSYRDAFDYIAKDIDLFDYLKDFYKLDGNSSRSFSCIFHTDEKPSASIFKSDSGINLYCCHSGNCSFKTGNIVQVVQELENRNSKNNKKCSRTEAMKKICRDLNVEYEQDLNMIRFIIDNLNTINDDIEFSHRELYAAISRYLPTLKELHETALRNTIYSRYEDEYLFSASVNYIAEKLGRKDKKNTGADISLLCLLKMIEKVDIEDEKIPDEYKAYIKRYQQKDERQRHINVYSLPAYTHEKLNECNEMAKAVKEKNLRKRHFTYESVMNAFDRETADRVFPQVKNKPVKAVDEYLLNAIRFLIDTNGYATQKTVENYYVEKGKYFDEMKYIKQIPAIIQRLDLKKIKSSKYLKEKYNIVSSGYPNLLVKQGDV